MRWRRSKTAPASAFFRPRLGRVHLGFEQGLDGAAGEGAQFAADDAGNVMGGHAFMNKARRHHRQLRPRGGEFGFAVGGVDLIAERYRLLSAHLEEIALR